MSEHVAISEPVAMSEHGALDYSSIDCPTFVDFAANETAANPESYFDCHDDSWISTQSSTVGEFSLGKQESLLKTTTRVSVKLSKHHNKQAERQREKIFHNWTAKQSNSCHDQTVYYSDCLSPGSPMKNPELRKKPGNERYRKIPSRVYTKSTTNNQKKIKSTAEVVQNFKYTLRRQTGNKGRGILTRTKPTSPKLQAGSRARKVNVLSRQQEEDLEVEKMRVFRFKANPVNPKILAVAGVVISTSKTVLAHLKYQNKEAERKTKFSRDAELPDIKKKVVDPISKMPTIPEPFTFDERDKKMAALKEERIRREIEEERQKHEFVANNTLHLPEWRSALPAPVKAKPTKTEPFNLTSSQPSSRWLKEAEAFHKNWTELHPFKAQPCSVLQREPFLPTKSHKFTNEQVKFPLSTAVRAKQRKLFDEGQRRQEEEKEREMLQRQEMMKREEEAAVAEIRARAVHRARPVPNNSTVFRLEKTIVPATVPIQPHFRTEERLRSKSDT